MNWNKEKNQWKETSFARASDFDSRNILAGEGGGGEGKATRGGGATIYEGHFTILSLKIFPTKLNK